jgi:DNA-directed RNA polymerase subunit D
MLIVLLSELMEVKVLEDSQKIFRFTLSKASAAYANALRRVAISGVPTFAIDKSTFYDNSSAMFDEYISHRVGLVPIATPSKGYSDTDTILFTLEAHGPKTVYSGELKSSDKGVAVANDNIPIIKLADGQKIKLEAKAVLGTASRHAKFQPGITTFEQKGDDTFEFYVESFGQMPPREIINKACDAIKEQAKEISKEVKKL